MIDSLIYASLPSKLRLSVNMARLESETNEEAVAHLERELELNGSLEEGQGEHVYFKASKVLHRINSMFVVTQDPKGFLFVSTRNINSQKQSRHAKTVEQKSS